MGCALRFEDLRRANAASSSGLLFQQLADEVGGVEDATMKLPLRILAVAVGSDYIFNRWRQLIHPINDDADSALSHPLFITALHGPHASTLDDDRRNSNNQGFRNGHGSGLADDKVDQAVIMNRGLFTITEHKFSIRSIQIA